MAKVNAMLPREHALTIRGLAREIDVVLAGFVRGQLSVCLILGSFYAVALMAIGLQFGFLVGLVAGMLSFIPYVGSAIGLLLSVGIALFQFWDDKPVWILATAGIFLFGQFVEGNVLAPNLIGKSVGLHPVWLILALSVFGALFGFAGLLVAVPVAAALGVIGRFLIEQYLASPLYTGARRRRPRHERRADQPAARARPAGAPGARAGAPSSSRRRTGSRWRMVDRWPDWPMRRLAVVGPQGAGKTHLAHVWAARAGAAILPVEALAALASARSPATRRWRSRTPTGCGALGAACGGGALPSLQPAGGRRRQPDAERARAAGALAGARCPTSRAGCAAAPVARLEPPDDALLGGGARQALRRPADRRRARIWSSYLVAADRPLLRRRRGAGREARPRRARPAPADHGAAGRRGAIRRCAGGRRRMTARRRPATRALIWMRVFPTGSKGASSGCVAERVS